MTNEDDTNSEPSHSRQVRMELEKAKDIALNKIPAEISVAHNAVAVYVAISENGDNLNASRFRQTMGAFQQHALAVFVLSICKIYEKHNQRPNYSIPTAIELLKNNAQGLAAGMQNPWVLTNFIRSKINSSFSECDEARIPTFLLDFFSEHCPQTPPRSGYNRDAVLDALKVLRDKRVAHHEATDISSMTRTKLDGALDLLAFAQSFVYLVGYGLFGFAQQGWTCANEFDPRKSWLWPEVNDLIRTLAPAS